MNPLYFQGGDLACLRGALFMQESGVPKRLARGEDPNYLDRG